MTLKKHCLVARCGGKHKREPITPRPNHHDNDNLIMQPAIPHTARSVLQPRRCYDEVITKYSCQGSRCFLHRACDAHQKSYRCTMNATCNWSSSYCNGSSLLVVDDAIPCATVVGRPVPELPRVPSGKAAFHARSAELSTCLVPRKWFKCWAASKAPDASLSRAL